VRFDQSGMSVWYGTPDAPAPAAEVPAGSGVTITVGVRPMGAKNRLSVHYRVNGGPAAKINASQSRTDVRTKSQYFSAHFPAFKAGDTVEYGVLCACAGHEIPSPGPPHVFPSSFRVAGAGAKAAARPASKAAPASSSTPASTPPPAPGSTPPPAPASTPPPAASGGAGDTAAGDGGSPDSSAAAGAGGSTTGGGGTAPAPRASGNVLFDLLASSGRTVADVEAHDAALFAEVERLVRQQVRGRLDGAFAKAAKDLKEHVAGLDLDRVAIAAIPDAVKKAIAGAKLSKELVKDGTDRLAALERAGAFADPLSKPDALLRDLPELEESLDQAGVLAAGEAARLAGATTAKVLSRAPSIHGIDDAILAQMVSAGELTDAQARELGLAVGAFRLFDEDRALTSAVMSSGDVAGGKKMTALRDLCALDAGGWQAFLEKAQIAAPPGSSLDAYARAIARRVAALYPDDAFMQRLPAVDPKAVAESARALAPIFNEGGPVLGRPFDELSLKGVDRSQVAQVERAYTYLTQLVGRYPGMDLAAVIEDPALSPEAKGDTAAQRVGAFNKVVAQRSGEPLLSLDYAHDGQGVATLALGELGLSEDDQRRVVSTLKAHQRLHALTGDVEHAHAFLAAGLHSATSAASMRFDEFMAATGLDRETAERHYRNARDTMGRTTGAAAAIADVVHGGFERLRVSNVGPGVKDMLGKMDGFSDMFGSQDYCECVECRSILGPAAYFVDLMSFVDTYVRRRFFKGKRAGHPLDLRTRRPDLWRLELSCENTTGLVPTLVIANEVLESYIARVGLDHKPAGCAETESLVFEKLAGAWGSFQQPFVLSVERLTAYLGFFGKRRADIARAVGAKADQVTRAELGIGQLEEGLITTPDLDPRRLGAIYGIAFHPAAAAHHPAADHDDAPETCVAELRPAVAGLHPSAAAPPAAAPVLADIDTKALMHAVGVCRTNLGALVASRFVAAEPGARAHLVSSRSSPESVQNDVEVLHDATHGTLDRMHRFARLWRRLPWSVGELDLVLTQLGAPLDLHAVVEARRVQERLGVSVEELCALLGDIPTHAVAVDVIPLMSRLFNAPAFVASAQTYKTLPAPAAMFLHPSLRLVGSASAADPQIPRLLSGLRVGDDDLLGLITSLAAPLGANVAATTEPGRSFALSAQNLSLLYRHARLAERLGLSIPALFQLIGLVPSITGGAVAGLADLGPLIDLHAWWKTTSYSLDDLGFILGGAVLSPDAYPDPGALAAQVIAGASGANVFSDTVFVGPLGVTEIVSRQILQAIAASVVADGGTYRLADALDPAQPLAIPAELGVQEGDVRAVLRGYHAVAIVPSGVAGALGLPVDKVSKLTDVTGIALVGPAMAQALRADVSKAPSAAGVPDAAPLVSLVTALLPLTVLFAGAAFDADAIGFVSARPDAFGLDHLPPTRISGVQNLSVYARVAGRGGSVQFSTDAPPIDPADVRTALGDYSATSGFPPADDVVLARVLRVAQGTISSVRGVLPPAPNAATALDHLARGVALARHVGVGGDVLGEAVSEAHDGLTRAADAMLAAFRARYGTEAEIEAKLGPYEDKLLSKKRDALTDYLMRSMEPRFESRRAIYEYFLVDVELEGCSRTSRVVSATNSVQLYVQRCLMDLEHDERPDGDPEHVHVSIPAEEADEWEWRKAYRMWQANRKIFLYPESYLEPDLRDDQTPLFQSLVSDLLQKQIDDQAVLDAYAAYVGGFEEVAKLTIAGAYHDVQRDARGHVTGDALHLVGVSASDPPTFYYRTREAMSPGVQWSPWLPITVQIPVRRVSPVVYLGRLHVFWIEIRTQSANKVDSGNSTFVGYRHKLTLKYTSLRVDGKWTPPQEVVLPKDSPFDRSSAGLVGDFFAADSKGNPTGCVPPLDDEHRQHAQPIDDYTLAGPSWEGAFLEPHGDALAIVTRDFHLTAEVDLFGRMMRKPHRTSVNVKGTGAAFPTVFCAGNDVYTASPRPWFPHQSAFSNLMLDDQRFGVFVQDLDAASAKDLFADILMLPVMTLARATWTKRKIAALKPGAELLLALPGSPEDVIVRAGADTLLLEHVGRRGEPPYTLCRIGTTLADRIGKELFVGGVDHLLALDTQQSLKEDRPPIDLVAREVRDAGGHGKIDFKGPYGIYYRELFFHIPFIIADHLNSQGEFEAAQRWYHHIFNPTADGEGADRVWRYLELRGIDEESLRGALTDEAAVKAYQSDPFNPDAIARLRLSAYQKCVVMKYIDNLLDWGDTLFTEFTMESVNEATMLYAMAADILGERPADVGDCGTSKKALTYARIEPSLGAGGSFLVGLESYVAGKRRSPAAAGPAKPGYVVDAELLSLAIRETGPLVPDATHAPAAAVAAKHAARAPAHHAAAKQRKAGHGGRAGGGTKGGRPTSVATRASAPSLGSSVMHQVSPVFCVPPNKDLFAYWDRVGDRLYKIHNCLDINGVRRDLALFAPEIDPRLLMKMKAEGLTLDDVMAATSGDLPPYRFLYLIEKAKAFASSLQSFGGALLSALEKKDNEALAKLRVVHEQHIAQMSVQLKQWEIDAADASLTAANLQMEMAQFRLDYYQGLIEQDLTAWERTEQLARHTASSVYIFESVLQGLGSVAALVPQLGSPFAMKYGGVELHGSLSGFASGVNAVAKGAEAVAASSSLEATFDRRRTDWKFQRDLAQREIAQLDRQAKAAEIRKEIAQKSLDVHQKTIEQTEEVYAFYSDKFTSFGLYTWMGATLRKSYRQAYMNALSIAHMCEAAFKFERDEDSKLGLSGGYWDGSHAGLLAGEQLQLDLQALERRFIETNYRTMEIEQSFPLTQLDPTALVTLRETGMCTFTVPEVLFDLAYPGQYRRRIKAVRLTIPCVTGPYTNVGATLTLGASQVRVSPTDTSLKTVPPQRTVSMATSKAQNDAGVFELSFHDERYMPFEGAGAVESRWTLELPASFRPFDYETISDVVLTINYTALDDPGLRKAVNGQLAQVEQAIVDVLGKKPMGRLFSLKQEFAVAFVALLASPPGTAVGFEIQGWHFPPFVTAKGRTMTVKKATLALKTADGLAVDGVQLVVDGEQVQGLTPSDALGGLPAKELTGAFKRGVKGTHSVTITAAGALGPAPAVPPGAPQGALDGGKVVDVLFYVEYTVATAPS
jgi:Tc toxin complex TcA C-terminal TcB-binding domain/Neuraminidase-like domain